MAAPIPRDAPVTKALLPVRRNASRINELTFRQVLRALHLKLATGQRVRMSSTPAGFQSGAALVKPGLHVDYAELPVHLFPMRSHCPKKSNRVPGNGDV